MHIIDVQELEKQMKRLKRALRILQIDEGYEIKDGHDLIQIEEKQDGEIVSVKCVKKIIFDFPQLSGDHKYTIISVNDWYELDQSINGRIYADE